MKRIYLIAFMLSLSGCAAQEAKFTSTAKEIDAEMDKAAKDRLVQPEAVSQALLPPITVELAKAEAKPQERKFDLVVNNAPANQVFLAIVSGTRYSMLVHPDVREAISVNLKDVTLFEALDSIRELYGYEYKVEGTRIYVQPLTLRTRVFQINYPDDLRKGTSDIAVAASGAINATGGTATAPAPGATGAPTESSKITTQHNSDFWSELTRSLTSIVGTAEGRNVVVSPQSGIIVVRAMPLELRNVAAYLKAAQLSVERQVIIEAKILEVQLNNGYQQGINWAAFTSGNVSRGSISQLTPNTTLNVTPGPLVGGTTTSPTGGLSGGSLANVTIAGTPISTTNAGATISAGAAAGTLFGLAFQAANFAALITFLETQGNVHVLSSPRIATLNNVKAVLKVGADQLFVTNVTSSTTVSQGVVTSSTAPTVTFQSFFSGVALDVTPRIDEDNNIILHIHPSVSNVEQVDTTITLSATQGGPLTIPVPRSSIQETDSIIRAQNGQIVAIGGLMTQIQTSDRSQIPGLGDVPVAGNLFGQTNKVSQKRELVILLKPTVVLSDKDWQEDILQSSDRMHILKSGGSSSSVK
ncbi:MAG TPA: pilus (MSHA type) biogenesis protein MshL [Burkholderiales bacterium]|nr:pilus (MSHA type) biogenesis protein MshL [Burkholderiales bacterium]